MTRYKGRQSAKAVEQDFPNFVDVIVPLGGLGNKLDAMYDFHARHGIRAQRGHGRHDAKVVLCDGASLIRLSLPRSLRSLRRP